jgi:DNA invertase Pin-like site-specific DNA recombinase
MIYGYAGPSPDGQGIGAQVRQLRAAGRAGLVLTVLGGLAAFERELIRARTVEGRARAVARGARMGRPPKLAPRQRQEVLRRREAGEPMRDIARSFNVSHSTISPLAP